ncbi:MAG TPA: heme ABC exporter ATP-binding protein CcmA [Gemmatimonadales bacterium]|nr:heme ABC exporter ATP-binding protein CcmA [Gemmatimonadales bacterium]
MPSSDGPLLEARGLRRSFGRVRVLRDVDLTLAAGEALAVAGPNGAGKTTLLRVLAGLMRPTGGTLAVLGRPLGRIDPEGRRQIGLVSHHSLLYDDLTLAENLTFAARLYGLDRPGVRALEALDAAGLGPRAGDSPRRLSRGLAQRAAIARALLHRPRILLLDEPFTALDSVSAERLREELRLRLGEGLGLVIVTHHLAEVWDVASRVAVMVDGRWAADAPRPSSLAEFLPRYQALIGA